MHVFFDDIMVATLTMAKSTGGYVVKTGSGALLLELQVAAHGHFDHYWDGAHLSCGSSSQGDPLDVPVHGGAWLWCFWSLTARNGQSASLPLLWARTQNTTHSRMKHLSLCLFWLRDAVQALSLPPLWLLRRWLLTSSQSHWIALELEFRKEQKCLICLVSALEPCTFMGECCLLFMWPLYCLVVSVQCSQNDFPYILYA